MATTNLNLSTFSKDIDVDENFEKYRADLAGPDNSNMSKIDAFASALPLLITALSVDASGSVAPLNTFITNASGSVATAKSASAVISASFVELGEFTGAGQADFNNISSAYTHLVLIGTAETDDNQETYYSIGCDFNADTTAANYLPFGWSRSGSQLYSAVSFWNEEKIESFTTTAQICLGKAPTNSISYTGFGSSFFAIIPNYSVNGGFYKTGMGLASITGKGTTFFDDLPFWFGSLSLQGGTWKSTVPITRVRVFASGSVTNTRYDMGSNTVITLYGIT